MEGSGIYLAHDQYHGATVHESKKKQPPKNPKVSVPQFLLCE